MAVDCGVLPHAFRTFLCCGCLAIHFIPTWRTGKMKKFPAGSAFAADIAFYYTNYVILAQRECMLSFGLNASNNRYEDFL